MGLQLRFKLAKRILVLFLINCAFGSIHAGPSLSKAKLSAEAHLGLIKVIQEGEGRNFKLDLSARDLPELDLRDLPLLQLQHYTDPCAGRPRLPDTKFHVSNVTDLDLSDNQLATLPTGIDELRDLTGLDLSNNNLSRLSREIGALTQLIVLKIRNKSSEKQKLQSLPVEIGRLRQLMILDLSGNELRALPREFGNLTKLVNLNLSGNKFQSFPMPVTQTRKLRSLDLSGNEITELPPEIGSLEKLGWLKLSNNKLRQIPVQIIGCSKLRGLVVDSNNLKSIPAIIGSMASLTSVSLYLNPLFSLPAEFVARFGKDMIRGQYRIFYSKLQAVPPVATKCSHGTGICTSCKELQTRFEQLKQFIFKAIEDNHLPDVRGFIHLRAEPWHLHLKDFKDERDNNLLHLAVKHNVVQQDDHAPKTIDSEWCILKELLACNVNDSVAQMLQEENVDGKKPLELLLAVDGDAFDDIYQKLCLTSAELAELTDEIPTVAGDPLITHESDAEHNDVSPDAQSARYGPEVSLGKHEA